MRTVASRGAAMVAASPSPRAPVMGAIATASVGLSAMMNPNAAARMLFAPFAVAHCDGGKVPPGSTASAPSTGAGGDKGVPGKDDDASAEQVVDMIIASFGKVASRMGFGGACGFCAGYAVQQVSKIVAMWLGLIFVLLQTLAYYDYIEIKWAKLKKALTSLVDTDGDGEFSAKDMKTVLMGCFKVLKHNLPQASSFAPGFYYGLRF